MSSSDLVALGSAGASQWRVNDASCDLVRKTRAPKPVSFAAEPQKLSIDLARSAVIVIDMQNDFCHPDGWLAGIGVDVTPARTPIEPLSMALPAFRKAGVPVIWVNWGNRPDKLNLSPSVLHVYNPNGRSIGIGDPLASNGSHVLEKDSWAAAIVDELAVEPTDIHVDKYRMSGFWDTALDSILRNLGVSTLLFAGVNLDQCVFGTLLDANCLGYDCVLLTDCSATTSPAFCTDATIYNVKQCFGFTATATDIIAAID
ncbi:isochorismatase family cysteine hydrolase [Parvibaculum sp.]|uniref:cysteine hydrolase family protein n=1 Tax=Parvibaculum sp. TaxID=2024848 RepID=UPI00320FB8CA